MPTNYEELIKLPGIGEYTAGAIASISYNERIPAVDGNVLRVISRIVASSKDILLPQTKKEIAQLIKNIMPKEAGDFNEAIMELGELICLPNGEPECKKCPLIEYCRAYKEQLTDSIPVREKKLKRRKEEKTVLLLISPQGKIAIQKREKAEVLKGMYEFPNIPNLYQEKEVMQLLKKWNLSVSKIKFLGEYKHIFTHIDWKMYGYEVQVKESNEQFLWVQREKIEKKYAIPTAFKQFLKDIS